MGELGASRSRFLQDGWVARGLGPSVSRCSRAMENMIGNEAWSVIVALVRLLERFGGSPADAAPSPCMRCPSCDLAIWPGQSFNVWEPLPDARLQTASVVASSGSEMVHAQASGPPRVAVSEVHFDPWHNAKLPASATKSAPRGKALSLGSWEEWNKRRAVKEAVPEALLQRRQRGLSRESLERENRTAAPK